MYFIKPECVTSCSLLLEISSVIFAVILACSIPEICALEKTSLYAVGVVFGYCDKDTKIFFTLTKEHDLFLLNKTGHRYIDLE